MIDREPPLPSGSTDATGVPQATIVKETTVSVLARATAPVGGGYFVLLDSFDSNWKARVDGHGAPLLRADGAFRAVRLPAGDHSVQFVYRPRAFVVGATISCMTALILALAAALQPRLRQRVNVNANVELVGESRGTR
jgi:hypothetical protein